jgi:hypothetical protein
MTMTTKMAFLFISSVRRSYENKKQNSSGKRGYAGLEKRSLTVGSENKTLSKKRGNELGCTLREPSRRKSANKKNKSF